MPNNTLALAKKLLDYSIGNNVRAACKCRCIGHFFQPYFDMLCLYENG